jgi:hypothetical protein
MYQDRMLGYYPEAIQSILEFQAIIYGESPEVTVVNDGVSKITADAYLTTMTEERVKQWEKALGIKPNLKPPYNRLSDRKEAIIARVRGQGKLNTETINRVVKSFTGGEAKSQVSEGVLYIEVKMPTDNKEYQFASLEEEIASKVPAQLAFEITRETVKWGEVMNETHTTWDEIRAYHRTWEGLLYGMHRPTYHIVGGLINCSIDSEVYVVEEGGKYSCKITPNEGCALKSVKITMGDAVVMENNYSTSPIFVVWNSEPFGVTGDIFITAVAESTSGESDLRISAKMSTSVVNGVPTISGNVSTVDDGVGNVTLVFD